MRKKFCEYIGQYIFCRDIAKLYLTTLNVFANEVIIDVGMFNFTQTELLLYMLIINTV